MGGSVSQPNFSTIVDPEQTTTEIISESEKKNENLLMDEKKSKKSEKLSKTSNKGTIEDNNKKDKIFHVQLMDFNDFKRFQSFPCHSECQNLLVDLKDIDRDNSLVVFISHCWLRSKPEHEGFDGKPHPDNNNNSKHKLCIDGIGKTLQHFVTGVHSCYLWLDVACLDFHNNIRHLDKIMESADCMFTPLLDPDVWFNHNNNNNNDNGHINNYFDDYNAKSWNSGEQAYLNRAWCRLEMLYAASIPLHHGGLTLRGQQQQQRQVSVQFHGSMGFHILAGRRPHLIFGTHEASKGLPPIVLPPLQHAFFDRYSPRLGCVTELSDMKRVEKLLLLLTPLLQAVTTGYRGDFNRAGEMHGYGMCKYANGDLYEGEWRHDKKSGMGVMKFYRDGIYCGHFSDDRPCGIGSMRFPNGDVFEGEFRKGLFHCKRGVFKFANGDIYEGEFVSGKRTGQGEYRYRHGKRDGDCYEGHFFEDMKDGQGKYSFASGDVFEGKWRAGKKYKGKYSYKGGAVYDGHFENNKKNGHGIFYFTSGDRYDGNFKDDKMYGQGKYIYATGATYIGEFKDDLMHGKGLITYINGDTFEGYWYEGKAVG